MFVFGFMFEVVFFDDEMCGCVLFEVKWIIDGWVLLLVGVIDIEILCVICYIG